MKKHNIVDEISIKMLANQNNFSNYEEELIDELKLFDNLDVQGSDGRTVLIHASVYGYYNTVKFLIEKKADISIKDKVGYTALHAAVSANNYLIAELLLNCKAQVDELDIFGNTPLFRTSHLYKDMIILLLKYGANPFLKNDYGISPYDVYQSYDDIIKLFDAIK